MRTGLIATCRGLHEKDEIYILSRILHLRHIMFNVHTVTFRYIRILPNFTIQHTSFNIVTMLFAVRLVTLWMFKNCINVTEANFAYTIRYVGT